MNNKLSPVNSSESTEGEEVNRNDRSSAHRRDAESSRSSRKGKTCLHNFVLYHNALDFTLEQCVLRYNLFISLRLL